MDLIVETTFDFISNQNLAKDVESATFFLIEVLLLKDSDILFDEEKCRILISIIENPALERIEVRELQSLLLWKQVETLKKKYLSQFQVDHLIERIMA